MVALGRRLANSALHPTSARRHGVCAGLNSSWRVLAGERPCHWIVSRSEKVTNSLTVASDSHYVLWPSYARIVVSMLATRRVESYPYRCRAGRNAAEVCGVRVDRGHGMGHMSPFRCLVALPNVLNWEHATACSPYRRAQKSRGYRSSNAEADRIA